ncbi:MAG: aminodeoxychorismate/anthranilate synthase component II [Rhizobiales bacterium 65-9]|nr:aminodeoxychorismate/anthranilate synthase component II [Hyphomicrobiales bacterium]OJY35388.1 MAG: aminodeoxychorismate/anthranilate synthase component II [Rhizobiales bacterium 65-9]
MRVLLIDNYDSFTFNLVHLIGAADAGASVEVVRNDAMSAAEIARAGHDAIVLSPGPCTPNEAGVCLDVIRELGASRPIFGVCLGMQAMGQAHGGEVVRAPAPMHGKISTVRHNGAGLFRGVNGPIAATRYHSLIVRRDTCPADLAVTAETEDGLIMALSHRSRPTHGVQFHPESIASEQGATIIRNFLDMARDWNRAARRVAA